MQKQKVTGSQNTNRDQKHNFSFLKSKSSVDQSERSLQTVWCRHEIESKIKRLFQPLVQMWQMVTRINPVWTLDETWMEETKRCCDLWWRLVSCMWSFIGSGPCRGSTRPRQGGSSLSQKPELNEVQLPSEVDQEDWRCPRPLRTTEPWEKDQDLDLDYCCLGFTEGRFQTFRFFQKNADLNFFLKKTPTSGSEGQRSNLGFLKFQRNKKKNHTFP